MVVGSLKEETKILKMDEADVLLAADENIKNFLSLDKKHQRIKKRNMMVTIIRSCQTG